MRRPNANSAKKTRKQVAFEKAATRVEEHQSSMHEDLDLSIEHLEVLPPSLDKLKGLRRIYLAHTEIRDLSPLSAIEELTSVYLTNCKKVNLHTITLGSRLRTLNLAYSSISDLKPISNFDNLNALILMNSTVADIRPLKTLKKLLILDLTATPVADLTPLSHQYSLSALRIAGTFVSDLSALVHLTGLIDGAINSPRDLGLHYGSTQASQHHPLSGFVHLENPARTIETINHLRREAELPPYFGINQLRHPAATASNSAPSIPEPQPAAIEPIIVGGRITLPTARLVGDLDPSTLDASLKALKHTVLDLAADIRGETNIDRRLVVRLDRLANRIPETTPQQHELFALGHELEALQAYGKTVTEEWPQNHAVSFHAMTLAFERTVRQFPKWREFVRNAAPPLSAEQKLSLPKIANDIGNALAEPENITFVNQSVTAALKELAAQLDAVDAANDIIERGADALALDLLESTNNIMKLIARFAIALGERTRPERDSVRKGLDAARDEFNKDIQKLGPWAYKWLRRTLKVSIGSALGGAAATGLGKLLLTTYPQTFAWLDPILKLIF